MSLHDVYDEIPFLECKGLCADTCTTIPVSPAELSALRKAAGRRLRAAPREDGAAFTIKNSKHGSCPLLSDGRCTVYDHRPLICRLYGTADGLPCEHGCQPAYTITHEKSLDLMVKAGLIVLNPA